MKDKDKHIKILCHVEHAQPADVTPQGAPKQLAFGLSISVAVSDAFVSADKVDDLAPLLQPWLWNVTAVKVVTESGAVLMPVTPDPTVVNQQWDSRQVKDYSGLIAPRLEKEFRDCKNSFPDAFIWSAIRQPYSPNNPQKKCSRAWHVTLAQAAVWPAPFPQALNLSLLFRFPFPSPKPLYAVPVFSTPDGTAFTPKLDSFLDIDVDAGSSADQAQPAAPKKVKVCEYGERIGGFPVRAYIDKCEVRTPTAHEGTLLDLYTYWVDRPKDIDSFDEDWRVQMEARMANAFDLSRRIIECLRELSLQGAFTEAKVDKPRLEAEVEEAHVAAEMAVASLRDMTGVGVTRGPNGQSLLERLKNLLERQQQPVNLNISLDAIRKKVREKYGDLSDPAAKPEDASVKPVEKWRRFLSTVVPRTAALKVISDPTKPLSPAETVAELDQLNHIVFDPQNLWMLVTAQWRNLQTEFGLSDEGIDKLSKLVDPNEDGSIDLRRQLAYENVGVFWRTLVRMKLIDKGNSLVKRNFACLLHAYGLLRFHQDLSSLSDPNKPDPDCTVEKSVMDSLAANYNSLEVCPPYPSPKNTDDTDKEKDAFKRFLPKLLASIKRWTDTFDDTLTSSLEKGGTARTKSVEKKTPTPHSITMAVDKLDSERGTEGDPLTSISGVGVLMREVGTGTGKWRCLNMAVPKNSDPSSQSPLTPAPVLVPLRLSYRNDLRQALISYNNHPLATFSPAAEMTSSQPQSPTDDATLVPLLSYRYSTDERAKLPALKFGRHYEYLPFIIGNCGAIPHMLARSENSPCEIDLSKVDVGNSDVKDRLRSFDYRRRVPVGQVRVFDEDGRACLQIPPIPEDVYPRARDIVYAPPTPAGPSPGPSPTPTPDHAVDLPRSDDPSQLPLILLTPTGDAWRNPTPTFNFAVRLPATDINTWDRWVAAGEVHGKTRSDDEIKKLRVNIWSEHYRRLDGKQEPTSPDCAPLPSDRNAVLDDPALAHQIYFEIQEELGNGQSASKTSKFVPVVHDESPLPALPPADTDPAQVKLTMRPAQSDAIKVTVLSVPGKLGDKEYLKIDGKGTLNVQVTEGGVFRLKISCCLPLAALDTKPVAPFGEIWEEKPPIISTDGTQKFYKVSTYEMLIEVATSSLGLSGELDKLRLAWPFDDDRGSALKVSLSGDSGEGFPYLHRVELQRQMWRWSGRATEEHPLLDVETSRLYNKAQQSRASLKTAEEESFKKLLDKLSDWETKEFGARSDFDFLEVATRPTLTDKGDGSRIFEYAEYLSGPAVKEDLRAHHYRFKARAVSRYAGMLNSSQATSERWQSRFVPCRLREPILQPNIKLILPLTESFGASGKSNTAGLLVVLREPWHEIGGIGEQIEADVATVEISKPNAKSMDSYFEMGPDPILFSAGEAPNITLTFDKIRGPIGHTFDRTLDAALFTSTSFIIPAPKINNQEVDFAWKFCKLRIRRVIKVNEKLSLRSDFTNPFWVQYLPEFFLTDLGATKFANLQLQPDPADPGKKLSVVDRSTGKPVVLQPQKVDVDKGGKAVFELYLVLTRQVFDATGRQDAEEYLGIYFNQGSGSVQAIADWTRLTPSGQAPAIQASDKLMARIIEIQRRADGTVGLTSEDKLWLALFDRSKDTSDSQRARVVRISEPIRSQLAANPPC